MLNQQILLISFPEHMTSISFKGSMCNVVSNIFSHFQECGTPSSVSNGDFPWLFSIRNSNGVHICAGTLVTSNWIMTAASCFGLNR